MTSLNFVKRKKALWALAIVLAFLATSLPQTYQAQGLLGPVVNEMEPNDGGSGAPAQPIPFPSVVRGESAGNLVPLFLVFPVDIPPIISPLTGDVVGTPRQTQVILFLNAFEDSTDLFRFRLRETTNVSINLASTGGFHDLSGDAEIIIFGGLCTALFGFPICPPPFGPIVRAADLDLLLFNAVTGAFIDGAFDGPGGTFFAGGGVGLPYFDETLPSDVAPGSPFSGRALSRGQYIIDVDDFNKFTLFLASFAPGQNILTNDLVFAWEDSNGAPYTLRVNERGLGGGAEDDDIVAPRGAVSFEYSFSPTQSIRGAADDYYVVNVLQPGTYTFNMAARNGLRNASGHLYLLRLDQATNRWVPLGRSTVVNGDLESLPNVRLEAGRHMIATVRDGISPLAVNRMNGKRLNYAISVFDEAGQLIALQANRKPTLAQMRAAIQEFADAHRNTNNSSGGNNRK